MKLKLYKQSDTRWARVVLAVYRGYAFLMARWGCWINAFCTLHSYFYSNDDPINPRRMTYLLKFDDEGRVIHNQDFPGIKFLYRYYFRPQNHIITDFVVSSEKAILLELDKNHWVYCHKWSVYNLWWFLAMDPLKGKIVKIAKWRVTGGMTFKKKVS